MDVAFAKIVPHQLVTRPVFCTSGSEKEFTLEESWYADEKIQAGNDPHTVRIIENAERLQASNGVMFSSRRSPCVAAVSPVGPLSSERRNPFSYIHQGTEPIVGWRAWSLFAPSLSVSYRGSQSPTPTLPHLGWFLQSVYLAGESSELWLPDKAMCARCQRCSPPPGENCWCGIYVGDPHRLLDLSSPDLEYLPDIMPASSYPTELPLKAPENCWNAPSVVGQVGGLGNL